MWKLSLGGKVFNVFNITFMILIGIATLYPFWYVVLKSVMPFSESLKTTIYIFPKHITLDAYKVVLSTESFINAFKNSVFITVIGTVYQVFLTAMGAYSLTKKELPGRNFFFILILITMYFGGGLIPFYFLIRSLGLIDNIWVMIFPYFTNTFYLIVMKTFFSAIPTEMEESAKIDGAGYFTVFLRILLPLSKPVLATSALFAAVGQWNNWFTPTMFISERNSWPLARLLSDILINNNTAQAFQGGFVSENYMLGESLKMACIIVAIIPIIAVYPFVQKYFVKGVMIGAVKN